MGKTPVESYVEAIKETMKWGHVIGRAIVEAVKPTIDDIGYSLGWAEAGVDTICFWSRKRDVSSVGISRDYIRLETVIEQVFPELRGRVDAPYGVYLAKDEVKAVKARLEELRKKWEAEAGVVVE